MAVLSPPAYRTEDLAITLGDLGEMVTEASQFRPRFRLGRVYDDACDEGLTLVSHRTGRALVFAIREEQHGREGETQAWVLRSVDPSLPATLIVLND